MFTFRRHLEDAIPDLGAGLLFGRSSNLGLGAPGHGGLHDELRSERHLGRPGR